MFRDNKAAVFGLAVRGGLVASGSEDGAVRLWSTATHARVAVHWGHTATVMSVALSETCVLSTSEDATAMAWPLFDGTRLAVMRHPPHGPVSCVSTHGRLAVTSQAQSVIFWSLDTFKPASARIVVHDGATYSVHLRDTTLVTGARWTSLPCALSCLIRLLPPARSQSQARGAPKIHAPRSGRSLRRPQSRPSSALASSVAMARKMSSVPPARRTALS